MPRERVPGRIGGWITTYSGIRFFPLDPHDEEINIRDIARGLSNLCRFAGQVPRFYSVAQHSVLVSRLVPEPLAMVGLLHDATEAYLCDLVKPLKEGLADYREAEDRLWRVIATHFDLPVVMPPVIKDADTLALIWELRRVLGMNPDWYAGTELMKRFPAAFDSAPEIVPLSPDEAHAEFVARYLELVEGAPVDAEELTI